MYLVKCLFKNGTELSTEKYGIINIKYHILLGNYLFSCNITIINYVIVLLL